MQAYDEFSVIRPIKCHRQERDSETGLDYFGARYYGFNMGRFVTPDPVMASAHASNPVGADGKTYVTGLRSDSLSIVASTATASGAAGDSGVSRSTDTAITFINVNDAHSNNAYSFFTNTTEHELAHQFLGDVYKQANPFSYEANEFVVDARVAAQAAGASQQSFRVGPEPRRYAAPLNPEANKPQQ